MADTDRDRPTDKTAATCGARVRNVFGLLLVIIGSVLMAVAAFYSSEGIGWTVALLSVAIALTGYCVMRGESAKGWVAQILCAVAAVLVMWITKDEDLRNLGVAIDVAGTGIAAAFIG